MALSRYGRYEALRRIASGGMASVYLGRALGAGGFERLVAIKVMHEHIAAEPAFSGMFLDEARLAARIRHPNVVPTLDVADDGRFIVMEYVEGASLQAILEQKRQTGDGSLPLGIGLRIFLDVLAGLHAAHELCDADGKPLRLVHRDVSPHNVLVGVDGSSRITDFGIAYAEARITSTKSGQLKGKLPYMAPEQLEDGTVTRRTDVYSAGCVLFEMLSGRRLFKGGNEAAVACAVLAGPELRLADVRPSVPPAIDRACMRALTRHDERYESADAFAEALERAADEEGVVIARHREIGAVAQLPQMTFPPASTLTEDSPDPRPKPAEIDVPPTVRSGTSPSAVPALSLPANARTTAPDRPPPEVAEALRAAMRTQVNPAKEDSPEARYGEHDTRPELSAAVGVRPPSRSRASFVVAALVIGTVTGGIWWVSGRQALDDRAADGEPSASTSPAPARSAAAAQPSVRHHSVQPHPSETEPSTSEPIAPRVSSAPAPVAPLPRPHTLPHPLPSPPPAATTVRPEWDDP